MKRITVVLTNGGRLSAKESDEAIVALEVQLAEGDLKWLGLPNPDGAISTEHLTYVNLAQVVRIDLEAVEMSGNAAR